MCVFAWLFGAGMCVKIGAPDDRNKKQNYFLDINCVLKSRSHTILKLLIIKVNKHSGS